MEGLRWIAWRERGREGEERRGEEGGNETRVGGRASCGECGEKFMFVLVRGGVKERREMWHAVTDSK